jgi:hypothetical protein
VPPALFELFKILHSIRTFTSGMIRFIFSTPHHTTPQASHRIASDGSMRLCFRASSAALRPAAGAPLVGRGQGFRHRGGVQARRTSRKSVPWNLLGLSEPETVLPGANGRRPRIFGSRGFKTMAGLEQNTIVAEC